ncbi:Gti1/Pac2 family-domain-containing protein [Lentinula detonsa]|uniref:Gti1/Pac2 family-domain-containing protein n=1 Tax=Lentinula detonsa TaxID=2804962 RepID=A0A9W8NZD7_9AGAR|nr:Gti1/Pac2 family-domain-containing protein [Lentinula detonsa]
MASNSCSPDVPPFHGYVETTVNALRLIHAARQGVIPRITRRLNDTERRSMIKSGAVFIFSVEESGIKRWTDGLLWSPSRIVGNFLVYREINERASSRGNHKKTYTGDDSRNSPIHRNSPGLSSGYKASSSAQSGSDQGTFKPNGLIKKTITVTIEGSDLHLISYYTSEDIRNGRLKRPSSRPDIMGLYMPPHIFRLTNFRVPPKMETGPDGKHRLVPEPEEQDVDCKIEEQTYGSPTSSASPGHSPVDHPLNPLYPLTSANVGASFAYSRAGDRWQGTVDTTRIGTPALQSQDIWPLSPPSSHTHIGGSRRETGGLSQGESWISSGLQSGKSRIFVIHEPASPDRFIERSRARSSNPYQNAVAMRDHENLPGLTTRYSGSRIGRDSGSQRLPWMMSPDSSDRDNRSSHSRSSYSSSSSSALPFGEGYQSYGSGWSGNDHGIDIPTSQTPFSPSHQTYTSSYTAGSSA